MRIIVGIGGGIAAYKAAMLLRLFAKNGDEVIAMPTPNATKFVGVPTLEALSGNPVSTDVFDRVPEVNHVRQAEQADAVVIAPATADLLARLAAGRADQSAVLYGVDDARSGDFGAGDAHPDVGASGDSGECADAAFVGLSRD